MKKINSVLPLGRSFRFLQPRSASFLRNKSAISLSKRPLFAIILVFVLFAIALLFPIAKPSTHADSPSSNPSDPSISITPASGVTIPIDPSPSASTSSTDGTGTGSAQVQVSTTNSTGYTLSMAMSGTSSELSHTVDSNYKIDSITDAKTLTTMPANTWGYSKDSSATFLPVPNSTSSAETQTLGTTTVPTVAPDTYDLDFAAKVDGNRPTGGYTNTLVFTAVTNPIFFVLDYDANGGTGAPAQQSVSSNEQSYTFMLSSTVPTRDNYVFQGWCKSAETASDVECSGELYQSSEAGPEIPRSNPSITLKAIWQCDGVCITYDAQGGNFSGVDTNVMLYDQPQSVTYPTVMTNGSTTTSTSASGTAKTDITDGSQYASSADYYQDLMLDTQAPGPYNLTIYYATESVNYDWICVFDGTSYTPEASDMCADSTAVAPQTNIGSGETSGNKIGSGGSNQTEYQATATYRLTSKTARVYFHSDSSVVSYGFWAVFTGGGTITTQNLLSGAYLEPVKTNAEFLGWSTTPGATTPDWVYNPTATYNENQKIHAVWLDAAGTMQDFTCSALEGGVTTPLLDSRDSSIYYIGKLADGKCWMLDNLRLGGTSDITVTSVDTNIPSGSYTLPASTTSGFTWDTSGFTTSAMNADYKNNKATSYGDGSGKAGNYYNYCAASAGTYCNESAAGAGNAEYDICPKGWRMPTGGESGEYRALDTAYNDGDSFRSALSTPLSGDFFDNHLSNWGYSGYFWSSMYGGEGDSDMKALKVYTSDIMSLGSMPRCYGTSVRCVADVSPYPVSISSLNYGYVSTDNVDASTNTPITLTDDTATIGDTVVTAHPYSTPGYTYTFTGWINTCGSAVTRHCNLYADFSRTTNQYTISYNLDGGSYGSYHPTSGTYNTGFTISNPTRAGYVFKGWAISGMDSVTHYYGTSSSSYSTSTSTSLSAITATWFKNLRSIAGTVTFTAVWAVNYSVAFDLDGGALATTVTSSTTNSTTASGTRKTSIADGTKYANNANYYQDLTVEPGSTIKIYYATQGVSYDWICVFDGTSYAPGSSNACTNSNAVAPTTNTGSTSGKKIGGGGNNKTAYVYVATFKITSSTARIYFHSNASTVSYGYWAEGTYSTSSPSAISAEYGSGFNVANPTKAGYDFVGWTITGMDSTTHYYGSSASSYTTSTATSLSSITSTWFKDLRSSNGTVTFTANWTPTPADPTVTVARNNTSYGTVSASSLVVPHGSVVLTNANVLTVGSSTSIATPTSATGYTTTFSSWTNNCGGTVTADCTITANFSRTVNTYSISYNLDGGTSGGTQPASGTYDTGFTVSNPTKSGYTFKGWTISGMDTKTHYYGTSSSSYSTSTASSLSGITSTWFKNLRATSGTVTFTAVWGLDYSITYNDNGGSGGPGSQSGNAATVTISSTEPTLSGKYFHGWASSDTATTVEFKAGATYDVSNFAPSKTLYAVWKDEPATLYMQDVATWASQLAIGDQIQVVDRRDNKMYWVARLKTNTAGTTSEIWMTQNLDYDIKTSDNIVSLTSNGTATTWNSSYAPQATSTTLSSQTSSTGTYSWDPGNYYVPDGGVSSACTSWPLSGCTNGVAAANSLTSAAAVGDTTLHYHVGNYYQYNAVTAGYSGTITRQDASASICPTGWRLATSNSYTNNYSFGKLTNAYGITSSSSGSSDTNLRAAPLYFVRGGYVYGGSLGSLGIRGYVWSSMAASNISRAYDLDFYSSNVLPSGDSSRYLGFSARCVAI